jgi:hypothetical protein
MAIDALLVTCLLLIDSVKGTSNQFAHLASQWLTHLVVLKTTLLASAALVVQSLQVKFARVVFFATFATCLMMALSNQMMPFSPRVQANRRFRTSLRARRMQPKVRARRKSCH